MTNPSISPAPPTPPEGETLIAKLRELATECTEQMESEPCGTPTRRTWWREMGDVCDAAANLLATRGAGAEP